jgi:hypothetical protein
MRRGLVDEACELFELLGGDGLNLAGTSTTQNGLKNGLGISG